MCDPLSTKEFDDMKAQKDRILAKLPQPIDLSKSGLVQTLQDYYFSVGDFKEVSDYEAYCDNRDEFGESRDRVIEYIISLDTSMYIMRRIPNVAGEVIDSIWKLRNRLIAEHEEYFGTYRNPHDKVDF